MTVTLGGIELHDHLVIRGLETAEDLLVESEVLLTGDTYVWTMARSGGRKFSLWGEYLFTLEQIEAIKALARLRQPVELVHHRGTFTVLITGTPVEPRRNVRDPLPGERYSGEITFIEV
jgi:hypothetical protein